MLRKVSALLVLRVAVQARIPIYIWTMCVTRSYAFEYVLTGSDLKIQLVGRVGPDL